MRQLGVITALLLSASVFAAPQAESIDECYLFSDVALTAKSLALENVPIAVADRVLGHIYRRALTVTSTNGHERHVVLIGAIATAARRQDGYGATGFAQRILTTCAVEGGNMDSILEVKP